MLAHRSVLIVEDEDILAANLQAYLEKLGCEVRVARDGASAIEQAHAITPEILVLDYRLPDMSGLDVFDALRPGAALCCVLMTGHSTPAVLGAAVARGIEDVLLKPFALHELAVAICNARAGSGGAAAGPVERRRGWHGDFPLRLFDGAWVHADRRRPPGDAPDPVPDAGADNG